jgi:hypothetical protein
MQIGDKAPGYHLRSLDLKSHRHPHTSNLPEEEDDGAESQQQRHPTSAEQQKQERSNQHR